MYHLYLIQSQLDQSLYIGTTSDLRRRLLEHNAGFSEFTSTKRPWKLIYCESYAIKNLAIRREKQLKRFAKSYAMLKRRLGL